MRQGQKSELTKEVILDKSFELFYENGFKSTSVDKIMEATKLTKGAFYYHYKSKKELGLAVISQKVQRRVYAAMIAPLYNSGNAVEILESTFLDRIRSFPEYDKQHGCPMNNFINEIADFEEAYQLALRKIIDEWRIGLIALIERGKAEKTIKEGVASHAVAIYLISAFEGIRGIRKLYEDDQILEEYISGLSSYIEQIKT